MGVPTVLATAAFVRCDFVSEALSRPLAGSRGTPWSMVISDLLRRRPPYSFPSVQLCAAGRRSTTGRRRSGEGGGELRHGVGDRLRERGEGLRLDRALGSATGPLPGAD